MVEIIKSGSRKYVKPTSLSWLVFMVPLIGGVVLASEPLHGWAEIAQSIRNASDMSPAALILTGLGGIGLRGAIK